MQETIKIGYNKVTAFLMLSLILVLAFCMIGPVLWGPENKMWVTVLVIVLFLFLSLLYYVSSKSLVAIFLSDMQIRLKYPLIFKTEIFRVDEIAFWAKTPAYADQYRSTWHKGIMFQSRQGIQKIIFENEISDIHVLSDWFENSSIEYLGVSNKPIYNVWPFKKSVLQESIYESNSLPDKKYYKSVQVRFYHLVLIIGLIAFGIFLNNIAYNVHLLRENGVLTRGVITGFKIRPKWEAIFDLHHRKVVASYYFLDKQNNIKSGEKVIRRIYPNLPSLIIEYDTLNSNNAKVLLGFENEDFFSNATDLDTIYASSISLKTLEYNKKEYYLTGYQYFIDGEKYYGLDYYPRKMRKNTRFEIVISKSQPNLSQYLSYEEPF